MAKKAAKKKEATKSEATKSASTLEDRLLEQYGKGVIVSGEYITEYPQIIVPVSPQIDLMLNGGIPFGSFVIPTGPPKVGKTSLSLDIAATALDIPTEFDNPRELFYYKVEGRLPPRDLAGIHHLRKHIGTKVHVIQSRRGKILTAEDYLDIAEQHINEKPGCIFIMDSMSQLCSSDRREKDWHDGKAYRDNVPTLLANFCKRISQVVPINDSLFFGITHQIANTGFGFSSWAEASGTKVQYQVDVKLKATHNKPWKEKEDSPTKKGLEVHWECYAAPLQNGESVEKTTSRFRFGHGVDKHAELLPIACDLNIIENNGAWYTIGGQKYQGKDKAAMAFAAEENRTAALDAYVQFRDMFGLCPIPEEYLHVCL